MPPEEEQSGVDQESAAAHSEGAAAQGAAAQPATYAGPASNVCGPYCLRPLRLAQVQIFGRAVQPPRVPCRPSTQVPRPSAASPRRQPPRVHVRS